MYPIEGVIATIEIKSVLDKSEFIKALDNCFSVLQLVDEGTPTVESFIYGFDGIKKKEVLGEHLEVWFAIAHPWRTRRGCNFRWL